MIKTIKIKLLPNNKQIDKMIKYCGASRFAYNWAINKELEVYKKKNEFIFDNELRKEFTKLKKVEEFFWLNEISNNVTKRAIKDACHNYRKFLKGEAGLPKYKSKKNNKDGFYQDPMNIKFTKSHVKLEGFTNSKGGVKKNKRIFNWVKLAEKNIIPTNMKYVNPRITNDGINWYVSIGVEFDNSTPIIEYKNDIGIGIDLGIKDLAICSNGNVYKNINKTKHVKDIKKKHKRQHKRISRKYLINKDGDKYIKTKNIKKEEKKLLKLNRKLSNIRLNYLHQTTSEIVKTKPSFIVIEDLNVREMMRNKNLSRAIQEQCFYEFRRQLTYKCKWNNTKLIVADRFFPSSKTCSCCGNVKKDLKLSDRVYKCECGNIIDRDYNASLNLKKYGESIV